MGYNSLTTLSSILTYSFCPNPIIFIAQWIPSQNRWEFKRITLSEIATQQISKSTQYALQCLRVLEVLKSCAKNKKEKMAIISIAIYLTDKTERLGLIKNYGLGITKKLLVCAIAFTILHYIGLRFKKRSLLKSDLAPIIDLYKNRFELQNHSPSNSALSPPQTTQERTTIPTITRQETLQVKQEPKRIEPINYEESFGNLSRLPDEILARTFSFLTKSELKSIIPVSRGFRRLAKQCMNPINYEKSFGNLSRLPDEILARTFSFLTKSELKSVAPTSRGFQALAEYVLENLEKEKIYKNYPREIVDAIGWKKLASSPILDLKTTLVGAIPDVSDAKLDDVIKRYRKDTNEDNAEEAVLKKKVGLNDLNQIFDEGYLPVIFEQNLINAPFIFGKEEEWPFVHQKEITSPHPFLYFIGVKDMGDSTIKRFTDAAGRQGIAFRLVEKISYNNSEISFEGVGILHQIHPKRKDWIWIENVPIRFGYDKFDESFSVNNNSPNDYRAYRSLRFFFFLHFFKNQADDECADNLKWLKKLASGQRCGLLHHGKEMDSNLHSFQCGECLSNANSLNYKFYVRNSKKNIYFTSLCHDPSNN